MKKLIIALIICLISTIASAGMLQQLQAVIAKKNSGTGTTGGPPTWAAGNFGTSTGQIVYAWDGNAASGTNYLYDSSGSEVEGSLTGASIEGTGADAYIEIQADGEYFSWSSTIDHEGPITVFIECTISSAVNASIWEFGGDATDHLYMRIRGTNALNSNDRSGATTVSASASSYASDGTTWNNLGLSHRTDAGDDLAASVTVGVEPVQWETINGDVTWAAAESVMLIGSDFENGNTVTIHARKFAVIAGWEQSVPW